MPDGKLMMQKWAHYFRNEIPQQGDILSEEWKVKNDQAWKAAICQPGARRSDLWVGELMSWYVYWFMSLFVYKYPIVGGVLHPPVAMGFLS